MQQDFHFNVVYLLCRCAGFDPEASQKVASASQYTDDCKHVGLVLRTDGHSYRPIQTQCPAQMSFSERWQRGILLPFHFLGDTLENPITVPAGERATDLLRAALGLLPNGADFALHALGIALHVFADTFSHQGFSAFHDSRNAVTGLRLEPPDPILLERITGRFLYSSPHLPPRIGHAEAVYCPDIPFLKWGYKAVADLRWVESATPGGVKIVRGRVERDNAMIASDAACKIASVLETAVTGGEKVSVYDQSRVFSHERFGSMTSIDQREAEWRDLPKKEGRLGLSWDGDDERCCRYVGKEWFGHACGLRPHRPGGEPRLTLSRDYEDSDWWKFQLAAKWVRKTTSSA